METGRQNVSTMLKISIMVRIENILPGLRDFLAGKDNVLLSFVFGSATKGRLTEESDIDIAILFTEKPSPSDILEFKDAFENISGIKTDIVILNDASPIIRMQVLKNGVLLSKKDDHVYNEFFMRTVKEYDDLKYTRREEEENILKGRIYA